MNTKTICAQIREAFPLIWLSALLVSCVFYIHLAFVALPTFDGGLNLLVAKSLAEGTGYGVTYNGFHLFPLEVQTNAPYIFPLAAVFRLGGVSLFTSQIVNLVYLFLFLIVLGRLLQRMKLSFAPLLACVLVLQTPIMVDFGMNGYGEIPAFFFFVLGLLGLVDTLERPKGSARVWGSGVAFGLAYLTKTVALFWIAPALVLFAVLMVRSEQKFRLAFSLLLGMVLPVLAWEAYRLIVLGGVEAFLAWWADQLHLIVSESSLVQHSGPQGLAKARSHLENLANTIHLPVWFLLAFWSVPFPLVIAKLWRDLRQGKRISFYILALFAFLSVFLRRVVVRRYAGWGGLDPPGFYWPFDAGNCDRSIVL